MNKKKNSSLMLKRILIIGLLSLVVCEGKLWAQNTDNSLLNLSLHDVPLKELFNAIEKQSDYTFVYDSSEINTNQKVSAVYSGQHLDKVLSETLKDMTYEIRGNQIIVRGKNQKGDM